jgi:hypothetical protein
VKKHIDGFENREVKDQAYCNPTPEVTWAGKCHIIKTCVITIFMSYD